MSVERPSSGFLSFDAVDVLVRRSLTEEKHLSKSQLTKNHRAIRPDSFEKVNNTIGLLIDLGVVFEIETGVELAPMVRSMSKDQLRQTLAARFLEQMSDLELTSTLAASLQYDPTDDCFWADRLTIPGSREHVPFLLLQFGIFSRDKLSDRFWRLSPDCAPSFLKAARRFNSEGTKKGMITKDQLDARLSRQEQRGREAEEWVVEFERSRLSDHPFVDQVERISDQDVAAGFDVLSFSSTRSLQFDRFIEVKSYTDAPAFYWSGNEISRAKELGERYILYIVDSSQCEVPDYRPIMIPGPYAFFFELDSPKWSRECTEMRFSLIAAHETNP